MEKEKLVFYDVDTQHDFMDKTGALYVPDAELIKPNLKLLTDFARNNNTPIIGSVDVHFGTEEYKHREQELKRWGGPFPDHCMADTKGQEKIKQTKLIMPGTKADVFGHGYLPSLDMADYMPHQLDNEVDKRKLAFAYADAFNPNKTGEAKTGIYFEKQSYDVFTNPAFAKFLDFADIKDAVVYGVATDYCVKAAVLGMQNMGIQTHVITDAIKGVAPDTTKKALEEMANAGAKFTTTKQILEGGI